MDPSCIFCKILAGDIPCDKVYEDGRVLAFLDVGPLSDGHVLVIPKTHAVQLNDMTDDDAAAIGAVLPKLARAVSTATGTKAYNILQNNGEPAGQVVMHVHFHLIPKPADTAPPTHTAGSEASEAGNSGGGVSGGGLGVYWPAGTLDPEAGKALAEKITAALV